MGTGTCKEPVRTQTCPAFPVRALEGGTCPCLPLTEAGSGACTLMTAEPQAAVLVCVGEIGPQAQLCVLGIMAGLGNRSTSTCAAGPGRLCIELSLPASVTAGAPVRVLLHGPRCNVALLSQYCTCAGSVCMAPIQLGFE